MNCATTNLRKRLSGLVLRKLSQKFPPSRVRLSVLFAQKTCRFLLLILNVIRSPSSRLKLVSRQKLIMKCPMPRRKKWVFLIVKTLFLTWLKIPFAVPRGRPIDRG